MYKGSRLAGSFYKNSSTEHYMDSFISEGAPYSGLSLCKRIFISAWDKGAYKRASPKACKECLRILKERKKQS